MEEKSEKMLLEKIIFNFFFKKKNSNVIYDSLKSILTLKIKKISVIN